MNKLTTLTIGSVMSLAASAHAALTVIIVPQDVPTIQQAIDLAGQPRFVDDPRTADTGIGPAPIVDLGAFEFQGPEFSIADINGDGIVDGVDLGIVLANWSIPAGSPGCGGVADCIADINQDGVVDGLDLGILLSEWTL